MANNDHLLTGIKNEDTVKPQMGIPSAFSCRVKVQWRLNLIKGLLIKRPRPKGSSENFLSDAGKDSVCAVLHKHFIEPSAVIDSGFLVMLCSSIICVGDRWEPSQWIHGRAWRPTHMELNWRNPNSNKRWYLPSETQRHHMCKLWNSLLFVSQRP